MDSWFLDDNWAQKQPASTPTLSSNPQTPIVSVKHCSIEDMWAKLSTCNSSDCNDIKQRLEWYKNLKDFKDSHKKQLESLLWKYSGLSWDPAKENFLIARLLLDLQWIEKQFQEDEKKIQADSQKWREFIFPTKYLDENEVLPNGVNNILLSIFWIEKLNNIRGKMEVAEKTTDTKALLERINSIKITSANIEKGDWDKFFIDLRTEIDPKDSSALDEFDKAVEVFKNSQEWKLYTDKTLWVGWLDIQKIWWDLDKEAKKIEEKTYKPWEKIELDIWNWSKVQFDTKESALRSIYKAKLIYDELSKMDSFKMMALNFWLSSLWLIKDIWLYTIWNVLIFALLWAPFIWPAESILRKIGDLWRTRLWDKWPIRWLWWQAESLENTDKSWKEWWKIKKWWRLVTTWPLSDFANIVSWLWDRYDRNEVKDNIWRNNFSIEDWLFSDPTKDIDITKEMNERVRLVSFFREKWKDNPENLAKLDRLIETSWIKEYITKIKYKNPADLISMWWQIFSPSKTFYLNLFEIDNWQTILWEKWWKPRFKWSYLNQPLHIIDPFFINYRKNVIEVINKDIKSIIESLKILYQVTEKDDWKIEIWEKTDFYKNLESSIDLNSEITLVEQKNRKTLFEQYIKDLRSWKLAWIKSNQFKVDLVLISMWKNTGGILTDKEIEVRLKLWEDMRWLKYNIEWIVWLDSNWHLNKWPEAKRKFIDTYSKEIAISNMLDNTLTIDSIKLELSKLFNDLVWNNVWWKKIEFMEWQVNFILKEIFAWKKYDVVKWLKIGKIDSVYNTHWNSDDIGRTLRDNLLTKMETELVTIESGTINEKNKKLKEFKDKYKFDDSLEDFMKEWWNRYDKIKDKISKITQNITIWLQDYVEKKDWKIEWEARVKLDIANKISPKYSSVIWLLERTILLSSENITIIQLENILKGVLTWHIKDTDLRGIKFNDYADDTKLSPEAKNMKIIEPKEVAIYDSELMQTVSEKITFTHDSDFEKIVLEWNSYIELYNRVYELKELKTEKEKLEGKLSETTPKPTKTQKDAINLKIEKIEEKIKSISISPEIKYKDIPWLEYILSKREEAFKKKLIVNPWFQEFLVRNPMDTVLEDWKTLWESFKRDFKTRIVKK